MINRIINRYLHSFETKSSFIPIHSYSNGDHLKSETCKDNKNKTGIYR